MGKQKQAVLELVQAHRGNGCSVSEVLRSVGVVRSSYYRWKKGAGEMLCRIFNNKRVIAVKLLEE